MRAGSLRHSITLQYKSSVSKGTNGEEVITWGTFVTCWADAQPLRGREYIAMRQAASEITTRFTIRYLAGVNTTMRVVWDSAIYNIVEVIDVGGRNATLELLAFATPVDS